ncbi:hypothetical protein LIER_35139 [Lithospermum erythrorhizon]|uniref:Uncharacterized protein n=1 Tax=Lithospermum erythrorhizon TaxID=34254 RepID=A0AAV3NLJ8_LITER
MEGDYLVEDRFKIISCPRLFMWNNKLYAKWEIYEYFEDEMDEVWKENDLIVAPLPPRGWKPRSGKPLTIPMCEPQPTYAGHPPAPPHRH